MRRDYDYDEPDCEREYHCDDCEFRDKEKIQCAEFYQDILNYLYKGKGSLEDFEGSLEEVSCYFELEHPSSDICKILT